MNSKFHPPISDRKLDRKLNPYVAEFTTRAQPPPRPFKPNYLRAKELADPAKPRPYAVCDEPMKIKRTRTRPAAHATLKDSRQEKMLPSPPTLDEFIRVNSRKQQCPTSTHPYPKPITMQPTRPGRHGFICPSCRKCTCPECVDSDESYRNVVANCDSLVDKISCFCLVKGCSYHLSYDETGNFNRLMSDKPASCQSGDRSCVTRWALLTAITVALPCLLIYPLYNSSKIATNKITKRGCECNQNVKF